MFYVIRKIHKSPLTSKKTREDKLAYTIFMAFSYWVLVERFMERLFSEMKVKLR